MRTKLFTSAREKRLWIWALIVVVAIYSTLGLAGTLVDELQDRELLDSLSFAGFLVLVAVFAASGLLRRPGWRDVWVLIGAAAVYGLVVIRMGIDAVERTHLFEYGLVAVLVHQALIERSRLDDRVRTPAVMAVVITALVGLLDESIQAALPNRYFDLRDIAFNSLAALMAVATSAALAWGHRWTGLGGRSE